MATKKTKKQTFTEQELAAITRIQQESGVSRKAAIKKMRKTQASIKKIAAPVTPAPAVEAPRAEPTKTPAKAVVKFEAKSPAQVSAARSEGIRLFKLSGRPTKEQFILVYGEKGAKMTWDQRAAAGVPAEQFQAALAAKVGK